MRCSSNHADLRIRASGEQFFDSNIRMMKVRFYCGACGAAFRASGIRVGISIDAPSTMDDGETIAFPIVPVGEEPNVTGEVFVQ
jgi:hypothetical protein